MVIAVSRGAVGRSLPRCLHMKGTSSDRSAEYLEQASVLQVQQGGVTSSCCQHDAFGPLPAVAHCAHSLPVQGQKARIDSAA